MSGLSYSTLNALRGGYSGNDPDLEAIYGLGVSSGNNALNTRNLTEQLKLARQKLASSLIESGWGTKEESEIALKDITGYNLTSPYIGLSKPTDVTNVSNLANLMNMQRYSEERSSLANTFRYGAGQNWRDYSAGIGQMARKILNAY